MSKFEKLYKDITEKKISEGDLNSQKLETLLDKEFDDFFDGKESADDISDIKLKKFLKVHLPDWNVADFRRNYKDLEDYWEEHEMLD